MTHPQCSRHSTAPAATGPGPLQHRRTLWLLGAGLTMAPWAHAYVDPGTGMMAIQALIALGIGIVAFVRHPIQTLKRWWDRLRGRSDDHA